MGAKHTRPCGAYADVKELEYVSALHQTGRVLRKDGSIRGASVWWWRTVHVHMMCINSDSDSVEL